MIRGLTRSNLAWMALYLALVPMIASADGYLKLNFSFAVSAANTVRSGGQNLWKAQGEAARSLDAYTQARYAPTPDRLECATTPIVASELGSTQLAALTRAQAKDQVISAIGQPYCTAITGADLWLVEGGKQLSIFGYDPISMQLTEAKP